MAQAQQLHDSVLTGAVLALVIMLLGCAFLLILCSPRRQSGFRVLMLTIAGMSVAFGVWASVLRSKVTVTTPETQERPVSAPHQEKSRRTRSWRARQLAAAGPQWRYANTQRTGSQCDQDYKRMAGCW